MKRETLFCDWCLREVYPDKMISRDVADYLHDITLDVKGSIPKHYELCHACTGELLNTINELAQLKGWKKV